MHKFTNDLFTNRANSCPSKFTDMLTTGPQCSATWLFCAERRTGRCSRLVLASTRMRWGLRSSPMPTAATSCRSQWPSPCRLLSCFWGRRGCFSCWWGWISPFCWRWTLVLSSSNQWCLFTNRGGICTLACGLATPTNSGM